MAKYFKSDDGKKVYRKDTTTSLGQMISQSEVDGTNGKISTVSLANFPMNSPVPDGFIQASQADWEVHKQKLTVYLNTLA